MRHNCWPIRNFPYLFTPSFESKPREARRPLIILEDFLPLGPRLRHVGRLKVGSNEGKLSRVPISRDTFICWNMVGRASDGGRKQVGSPRDRNLSTCSTSCSGHHHPPLSTRGELGLYPSTRPTSRYAFLKSVSVFVRLIPPITVDTWIVGRYSLEFSLWKYLKYSMNNLNFN